MSGDIRASAPGKLILLGEYAVLEGAPAVVQAVDAVAEVRVHIGDAPPAAGNISLLVAAEQARRLQLAPDELAQLPLLQAVADYLAERQLLAAPLDHLGELRLDTAGFFRDGEKLGLGSSAALTVCLVGALARPMPHEHLLPHAVACHRRFQGGRGSGADIACSLFGGVNCYQSSQDRMTVEPLTLPEGLFLGYVWSRVPASTSGYLQKLRVWRDAARAEYDRLLGGLAELAARGVSCLRRGDPAAFIEAADGYDRTLLELSRCSGTGFYSRVHLALRELTRAAGGVYKLSGAGGGDFGLFMAPSRPLLEDIRRRLNGAGHATDPVAACRNGLNVQRRHHVG